MEKTRKNDRPFFLADLRMYIDSHLKDDISITELAKHYGYSYERFRKIYQSVTGTTLHHYICNRQLQAAAKRLRLGANVSEAYGQSRYQTLYGFTRGFKKLFGVSPYEYAATRGRILMSEPELQTHPDFWTVGYAFEAIPDLNWMESGAYWQGQQFPPFNAGEFLRIGAGPAEASVWSLHEGKATCVFGWEVAQLRYTPADMLAVKVPGGDFLVFHTKPDPDNAVLGENLRATWYYAYEQWIPESDYVVDWTRRAFEYYLNAERLIYLPVKPRTPETEAQEAAERALSEQPPVLLQGSRGRWDRWEEAHKA